MSDEMNTISINDRLIGGDNAPYIIAEMSGNHNGDIERAFAIMRAMKDAGADAVKLQTYTADTITIEHDSSDFAITGGLWDGRSLYELYQEAHTPWAWHEELFAMGRELGITVFSSPFDESAIDFLEGLDCPAYKIASFEAMDWALIKKAASTGKPLIVSTGMITVDEIDELIACVHDAGGRDLALLHCVSAYPAPPEASNIRSISAMAQSYDTVVGLSDHTPGTAVAVAAVGLGASVIEKHVTLARDDGGPDSAFSMEPDEFAQLVRDCRTAWLALGTVCIGRQPGAEVNAIFRRSLYAVADIDEGETLTASNVRSIRPGYGLAPKHLAEVLGRKMKRKIARGTPLDWDMLA